MNGHLKQNITLVKRRHKSPKYSVAFVRDTLQKEYTLQERVDHPLFFCYNISLRINQYSRSNILVGIHSLILTEETLISIHQVTLTLVFITQYLKLFYEQIYCLRHW